MKVWLKNTYICTNASTQTENSRTNEQHLKELRLLNKRRLDVSHAPEKAFNYLETGKSLRNCALISVVIIIVASLLLIVIKRDQAFLYDRFTQQYVIHGIEFCCTVLVFTFTLMSFQNLMYYHKYLTTRASNHIGKAWGTMRQQFIDLGFVDVVVSKMIKDGTVAVDFLGAHLKFYGQDTIESMYLKFLEDTAIPYVKSQQTGIADPAVDNVAKARFELALSLVPYLGIKDDICRIRQIVYDSARDRTEEEAETQEFPVQ